MSPRTRTYKKKSKKQHGGTIENKNTRGRTQIMRNIITYENNAGKAKVLNTLAKGAKLNATNVEGLTPLHHLFLKTDEDDYPYISDDLVQALIAKGANVNTRDNNGDTPLNLACEHGRIMPSTIRILLAAGAHPGIVNNARCTPLLTLLRSAPPTVNAVADVLIDAMTPDMLNIKDIWGNTALHYAAQYDNTHILVKLLVHDININITNNKGQTPIYVSIKINNLDGVFQLLIHSANIKIQDKYGNSPLDDAIQQVLITNAAKKQARSRNAKKETEERAISAFRIKEALEDELRMLEEGLGNNNNQYGAEFFSR
jgi:ankyrin repeat protein